MSESKFTPGPWRVDATYDPDGLCILAGEERWICGLVDNEPDPEWPQVLTPQEQFALSVTNIGNARLIAAAPELYEALEEAGRQLAVQRDWIKNWSPQFESESEYIGDAELADAAIDKAKAALLKATEQSE